MEVSVNPVFRHETNNSIIVFDFTSVLYFEYDKNIGEMAVHFYDAEHKAYVNLNDQEFMNLITKWKAWKIQQANKQEQTFFIQE